MPDLLSYDPAVRAPIYRRISRIVLDNLPEYTLSLEPQIVSANDNIHGIAPNPVDSDLWNVAGWTIRP